MGVIRVSGSKETEWRERERGEEGVGVPSVWLCCGYTRELYNFGALIFESQAIVNVYLSLALKRVIACAQNGLKKAEVSAEMHLFLSFSFVFCVISPRHREQAASTHQGVLSSPVQCALQTFQNCSISRQTSFTSRDM